MIENLNDDELNKLRIARDSGNISVFYKPSIEVLKRIAQHKGFIVLCDETSMLFSSAKDAADYVGCQYDGMKRVCRGLRQSIKGLHFRYLTSEEI